MLSFAVRCIGLEDDPEIPLRDGQLRDVATVLDDAAAILPVKARDGAQKRGLAAAGGAEETGEFPRLHVEINAAKRLERAVGLYQPADFQLLMRSFRQ